MRLQVELDVKLPIPSGFLHNLGRKKSRSNVAMNASLNFVTIVAY